MKAAEPPVVALGVWHGQSWYLYRDQKYWHKDIEMLADLRRAGIARNTNLAHRLAGQQLEYFVQRCLNTEDYRVLGLPLEKHDIEFLSILGPRH